MTALVTGVAGFIGSHLAESLLDDGVGSAEWTGYPTTTTRPSSGTIWSSLAGRDGFELSRPISIRSPSDELLEEVEVIYHLAGQPGVRVSWGSEFEIYIRDNVLSTQRLLEACRDRSLERFVLASSSSIYGDAESFPTTEDARPAPVSPYGLTKLAAEHLCRLYHRGFGIPTVALRYFTIFGPRQRPGHGVHSFHPRRSDRRDDRGLRRRATGARLHLRGGRGCGHRGRRLRGESRAASTTSPVAIMRPSRRCSRSWVSCSARRRRSGIEAPVIGDARKTGADTTRAREVLGYEPRTSLREGLANQVSEQRGALARSGGGSAGS